MSYYLQVTLFLLVFPHISLSQVFKDGPEQDCSGGIPICSPFRFSQNYNYIGAGNTLELQGSSCGLEERNSTWYIISIIAGGELYFEINPNNSQDDFNWVLYDISGGCGVTSGNPATGELSCNASTTPGATGVNNTSMSNSQGPGGTPFNARVPVGEGQVLALCVLSDGPHDGYMLDFTETRPFGSATGNPGAVIGTPTLTPPSISRVIPQNYCGTNTKVFMELTEPILCGSISSSDFVITGPGGPYTVTSVEAPDCSVPNGYIRSLELNVTPPIQQAGTYIFSFASNATSQGFCGSQVTGSDTIIIRNLAIDAGNDVSICFGDSTQLLATPNSEAISFSLLWTPGTGLNNRFIANPIARPGATTTYVVRVSDVSGNTPCFAVDSIRVEVRPLPIPTISRDTTICSYGFAQLQAGGGISYKWSPEEGLSNPNIPNPEARPTTTTTYSVLIEGVNGCVTSASVTVNPAPPVIATVQFSEATICLGEQVLLTAFGGTQYVWQPQTGLSNPFSPSPRARPTETTNYRVFVYNDLNCVDSTDVRVVVEPTPVLERIEDQTVCLGSSVELNATGANAQTFAWSPAEGLSCTDCPNPIATPSETTTYTLIAGNNASICTDTETVTITVGDEVELLFTNLEGDTLDFGELSGCETSRTFDLEIFNTCDKRVDITGVFFSDTQFSNPQNVSIDRRVIIPPLESRVIQVRFAPTTSAVVQANVVLLTATSSRTVFLNLRGAKPATFLETSLASVEYGVVPLCTPPAPIDTVITLTNASNGPLTVETLRLGAGTSLVSPPTFPVTVVAGGSISLNLRFAPVAEGNINTRVAVIFSNEECRDSVITQLGGRAEAPAVAFAADSLRFAPLQECDTEISASVPLRNTSSFPIVVTQIIGDDVFFGSQDLPFTLLPNEEQEVAITARPTGVGDFSGRIEAVVSPCGSSIPLTVSASKAGVSFATPASLDFGIIPDCGPTSAATEVRIENTGDGDTEGVITGIEIEGNFTTNIAIGSRIASGTALTGEVVFTPTGNGVSEGRLIVTLAPCDIRKEIALAGRRERVELVGGGTVEFGETQIGSVRTRNITWLNTGNLPVQIDRFETEGTAFTVTNTAPPLPATIAPGATLRITAEYRPTVEGVEQENFRLISTSPCELDFPALFEGQGTSLPVGRILADNATAPNAILGESSPFDITVVNDGDLQAEFTGWESTNPVFAISTAALSLNSGENGSLAAVFTPTERGLATAQIRLFFDIDTVTIDVTGRGLLAQANGQELDLGAIPIRTETNGEATATNTGDVPLTLIGARLASGTIFSLGNVLTGTIIAVGESVEAGVSFAPVTVGNFTDTILFDFDRTVLGVPVRGSGTVRASSRVSLPEAAAATGEIARLAMRLEEQNDLLFTPAASFRAVLRFNSTVLFPRNVAGGCTFEEGDCLLTIQGTWNRQAPVLFTLEAEVLLGNDEETLLTIENFEWLDAPDVDVATTSGRLVVSDICRAGGTRLVQSEGTLRLQSITPNPVVDDALVEYEVIERGYTTMYVVDALGREVSRLVDGEVIPGAYSVILPASSLPSGAYICVLQTPSQVRTVRFIIAK